MVATVCAHGRHGLKVLLSCLWIAFVSSNAYVEPQFVAMHTGSLLSRPGEEAAPGLYPVPQKSSA